MKNKIEIENTLPHILSAFLKHKDCSNELKTDLWNWLNDRSEIDCDSPEYLALILDGASPEPARETVEAAPKSDLEILASQLSDLIRNPKLPERLADGLSEAILDLFNCDADQTETLDYEKSPEYIAKVLRGYEIKQSKAESA